MKIIHLERGVKARDYNGTPFVAAIAIVCGVHIADTDYAQKGDIELDQWRMMDSDLDNLLPQEVEPYILATASHMLSLA
jgi:hypothetical protein